MAWRNPYYNPQLAHHAPDGFCNPLPIRQEPGAYRRWRRERKAAGAPHPPAGGYEAFKAQWWQPANFSGTEDALWWLGHACVLVRVGGLHVLTDPVLGARASPVSFAGPRRHTPVAAGVRALPRIDVVLISHNHYDHMDSRSVRKLAWRFPDATFLAPLGLARWLKKRGVRDARELDWWQHTSLGGARFHAVPAQHWSARTPWDRNRTLWCGWVIEYGVIEHRVMEPGVMKPGGWRFYFAGDTGYAPMLAQISERLGPPDLAALPIGAYAPRWFMQPQHIDPSEAVRLHRELGVRRSVPIHWGAFELADERLDEPPRLLAAALARQGVPAEEFAPLRMGGRLLLRG